MKKLLFAFAWMAVATSLTSPADAAMNLYIRVTTYNSLNVQTATATDVVSFSAPQTTQSKTFLGSAVTDPLFGTGFTVVAGLNTADSPDTQLGTAHTLSINVSYSGPIDLSGLIADPLNLIDESNKVIVEFLGTDYVNPTAGPAVIESNASPSTSGLATSVVTMISGVNNSSGLLPLIPGSTAGLVAFTSGSGSMGSASSVLMPNPVISPAFAISSQFSFYQAFTFDRFRTTGSGSLSAGSMVHSVPEPATIGIWSLLVGVGAVVTRRRRR